MTNKLNRTKIDVLNIINQGFAVHLKPYPTKVAKQLIAAGLAEYTGEKRYQRADMRLTDAGRKAIS